VSMASFVSGNCFQVLAFQPRWGAPSHPKTIESQAAILWRC
jgi:hypothetical protein